jgi:hypothetical protein
VTAGKPCAIRGNEHYRGKTMPNGSSSVNPMRFQSSQLSQNRGYTQNPSIALSPYSWSSRGNSNRGFTQQRSLIATVVRLRSPALGVMLRRLLILADWRKPRMLTERHAMGREYHPRRAAHALLTGLTLCITCVLSLSLHALAQESNLRSIPIAWFEEPDQHAPHWRVHFDPSTLLLSPTVSASS